MQKPVRHRQSTINARDPRQVQHRVLVDLFASYDLKDMGMVHSGGWLSGAQVFVSVKNLFNTKPPFASGGAGNSTGYPSFLYDARDMVVSVGLKLNL